MWWEAITRESRAIRVQEATVGKDRMHQREEKEEVQEATVVVVIIMKEIVAVETAREYRAEEATVVVVIIMKEIVAGADKIMKAAGNIATAYQSPTRLMARHAP
ncbi:hypothetical protein NTE_00586 [Candidatus Nitrososphaera evergladensis SR1]|uniref:Uncharacterized protein n=1 Tax=Candidatus Nitrososphaera evergladensis SR1 TaxID=1459636 RepID=A0A075MPE8_9ARCH|nr:hypothetical protein NTE_00586 [Candidatus Nitrososphaera evergladensis SR1]